MAESPVATVTDDSTEILHSEMGEKASLADADRSGDRRKAAAAGESHTSDDLLLLRRRLLDELRKLREAEKAERERDARSARLILLSLLLAVATPVLLWLSAGGEPLLLVWRLSLLLTAYFFLCAALLSLSRGLFTLAVDFSYGALLAYFAGLVVVFLNSVSAAAMAGHALAEHRQSDGAKRSADEIPTLSHDKEEYARCCRITMAVLSFLMLVAPTVFIAWELISWWLTIADFPVDEIVGDLSIVVMFYVFCFLLLLIEEESHFYTIIAVFLVVAALPLFFSIVFGDVAAMVVSWIGILALTVLLGYRLRLYSSYQQHKVMMMTRSDDKLDDQKQELAKSKDTPADDNHEPVDASSVPSPPPSAGSPPYIHPEEPILS
uniref:Transmembrane protein n=1 Tax=Oryza barthii TaxID=65489 RepID=A0A0D3HPN9_9ORYZ